MRICMVASESNPLIKTGGLADVCYSLSKELVVMGHEVSIILPLYKRILGKYSEVIKKVDSFEVHQAWRVNHADVYVTYQNGIAFYLIENGYYFNRDGVYGYGDDMERFAFFTLAAEILISRQKIKPDIVHIHDWHPGMLACLMREDPERKKLFAKTKIVLSIHNPAFQGMMPEGDLYDLYNLPHELYENGNLRFGWGISTLKAGIVYADKITTVSPTHRYELLTPDGSMGLSGVLSLRENDFVGILNGIDYLEFNPLHDDHISFPYSAVNFFRTKTMNKWELFKQLGIKDYGQPLYSFVSRVTWQKGMDIVFPVVDELASRGCNIIMLGSGEYRYEQEMERLRAKYPKNIAVYIGYNDDLAHKIYASSDFFFMPSLFEPCGLGQMIAQRYGTLPIVRYTGGLKDSVIGYDGTNLERANGFGFFNYSYEAFRDMVILSYEVYKDLPTRKQLVKNAMKVDNSWSRSAKDYLSLYKFIVK